MNAKKTILTPKSLVIGGLVAAATAFSATIVSPLSAKAQSSPVTTTPVSPVNTTPDLVNISNTLSGTDTTTATTTTTTTTDDTTATTTTTTTTTTTSSTSSTSSTTDSSATETASTASSATSSTTSSEATESSTAEVATTDTSTNNTTTTLETTNVSTGVEAQSGVSSSTQQTTTTTTTTDTTVAASATISVVESFTSTSGVSSAFVSTTASALGVTPEVLVQTEIFQAGENLNGNGAERQAALAKFEAGLREARLFELASYNNAGLLGIFTSYENATQVESAFSRLSAASIRFVARSVTFFASTGSKFRSARNVQFTIVQLTLYKGTRIRARNFPAARNGNNSGINDGDDD